MKVSKLTCINCTYYKSGIGCQLYSKMKYPKLDYSKNIAKFGSDVNWFSLFCSVYAKDCDDYSRSIAWDIIHWVNDLSGANRSGLLKA